MIFIDSTMVEEPQRNLPTVVASRQTLLILIDEGHTQNLELISRQKATYVYEQTTVGMLTSDTLTFLLTDKELSLCRVRQ